MRRGELLALRWEDVDFEKGVLYVHRTMSYVYGVGYSEGEPKTKASRRKITLPDVAVEALKAQKAYQEQEHMKAGEKWREQGIVFSSIYGGFLILLRLSQSLRHCCVVQASRICDFMTYDIARQRFCLKQKYT